MSILPALKQLKTTLLDDADLTAFCHTNFGKKLTIKRSFRDREEIGMDECPIILITRPSVERENGLNRVRTGGADHIKIIVLRLFDGWRSRTGRRP